jgi:hypothetical protein
MFVVVAMLTALTATVAQATLGGGSTFDASNGALDSAGKHDWNPAAGTGLGPVEGITCNTPAPSTGTNCGLDLANHSAADNSLGQGSKEDDTAPTVVTGSIPPSKDDLSRFYINHEKAGGNDYLYLAWERTNLLGSAHLDFEFNQDATAGANNVTPVRTAGDLLIDFDFGGSGVPVLASHTWITSGAATSCEVSNALPCWDKAVVLGANAEASVNNANLTDNNNPSTTLAGNSKNGINSTFGEAAINLTGANIFPSGVCRHFGSAYLKSRSSGNSFGSELKDFVSPIPINISNCGTIKIIKHTDPRGVNQSFGYTSDIAGGQLNCTSDTTPAAFSLNDSGNSTTDNAANTETCANVPTGTYHVTEGTEPAGFVLESLTCTATGGSTGAQDATILEKANITLVADSTVTCTYTNQQQRGAIKITKKTIKASGTGLDGATFSVTKGGTAISGSPFTTANGGVICVDGLGFGDYVVTETGAPTGYNRDDSTGHTVTVNNNATCADTTYVGEVIGFTDTPLTTIEVKVTSEVAGGTASNTVETFSHLTPGTYPGTVVVDP